MLAKLERGFELAVLLEDRFGLDHPLQHHLAVALELGVLVSGVPIVAGAADQPARGRIHFMKRGGDRARHVERGTAQTGEGLRGNQRQDQ
jgi:hypothetical protein